MICWLANQRHSAGRHQRASYGHWQCHHSRVRQARRPERLASTIAWLDAILQANGLGDGVIHEMCPLWLGTSHAVDDVAVRYWKHLPDAGGADTQDTRAKELMAFHIAAIGQTAVTKTHKKHGECFTARGR